MIMGKKIKEKEISEQTIREVMAHLGRATSERKKMTSADNGKLGGRPLKPLKKIACNCGGKGHDHKASCPRGRAIRYRQKHGLPLE
jgi:hypothetical protein